MNAAFNMTNFYSKIFCTFLALTMLSACQSLRYSFINHDINKEINKSTVFRNQFTGFTLYDPESKNYLCNHNDQLYFTPASNTKILTTYACLEHLGDSIASYSFAESGDSIFLKPLADPTFLHPDFSSQKALKQLSNKNVFIDFPDNKLAKYGSGWAWDDFLYSFQPERSWFPIYGNVVRIFNKSDSLNISPIFFRDFVHISTGTRPGNLIYRSEFANIFSAWIEGDTSTYEREIPFIYNTEILVELLTDTTHSTVLVKANIQPATDTLYSQATLQVLATMMLPSDNFIAEHLLVHCALMNGQTDIDNYRNALLKEWNTFLPDPINWKDGSGLSRYNLITPRSLVSILDQIYQNESWETIESLFPIGGVSGTLKNNYVGNEPYVFAKTGTLSNNHNLSGFLKTKSGKTLIFSLMNNNYVNQTSEVKQEMEKLLLRIHEAY
ncbi:MAG: D-alanyl-D-alanine carboxypeptidase/D-alanyl-D-alanine-endopeptidase (penicillin-binding protein 4) [Cyclobacteriaceae bacterium]|jgi:D-alanyl-D-alanine carboxypeptidase/D-alanyl-D-alanine-endopeptidase (penicillin-binding protein 4)